MWVRGISRSSKVVPFEKLGTVFYSPSIYGRIFSHFDHIFSVNLGLGSFKVTENGAVRQSMHDFLLDRHCNYSSSLYRLGLCELFDVQYYRDLEMWVRGHSRLLKLVPFESLGAVSYLSSIVTMAISAAVYAIFSVKE